MMNKRILMCYPQTYDWEETGGFIKDAFERLGCEIMVVDDIRYRDEGSVEYLNEVVLHAYKTFKPDVLFMLKSESITPITLSQIKCRKVLWHPDVRKKVQDWVVEKAKECDLFYTMSYGSLQEYKKYLGDKARYLPEACDPRYHHEVKTRDDYWKSDVNFIGTVRHSRIDMLVRAIKEGVDIKIWGAIPRIYDGVQQMDDTTYNLLKKSYMGRYVWKEMHSYPATGSISITWDWCPEVERSYSARIYRVMASKGLYLCRYIEGMEKTFTRGVHCDWFNSLDEMMDKINYYINNPKEMERIGENAQKEVYSNHTFDNRVKTIMEDLEKL